MKTSTFLFAAAASLLTTTAWAQTVLDSGSNQEGTYYYNVNPSSGCGDEFADNINLGVIECSSQAGLTVDDFDTNYGVAIPNTMLAANPSLYCGKRIVVNGRTDIPTFIWDGCARCATTPGLDFSATVAQELTGDTACTTGTFTVSWEILDENVCDYDLFNTAGASFASCSGASNNSSSSGSSSSASSATPSPSPSSTTVETPSSTSEAPASSTTTTAAAGGEFFAEPSSSPSPSSTTTTTTVPPPASPTVQAATTFQTLTRTITASGSPTDTTPTSTTDTSAACETGVWQCNGAVMEQCLTGAWVARATCLGGMVCAGGSVPYCTATASASA